MVKYGVCGKSAFPRKEKSSEKQFPIKNFLSPTPSDEFWSEASSFFVPETHKHMAAQLQHLLE